MQISFGSVHVNFREFFQYACLLQVLDSNKSKILGLFILFRCLVHCDHHLVLL